MELFFEELYSVDRIAEHTSVAIPFKKGVFKNVSDISVVRNDLSYPVQAHATAKYDDGSVKWLFLRTVVDLPKSNSTTYEFVMEKSNLPMAYTMANTVKSEGDCICVNTGAISFTVKNASDSIFSSLTYLDKTYEANQFVGPILKDGKDKLYDVKINEWAILEEGPLVTILLGKGSNILHDSDEHLDFEVKLTAYANKSYIEVAYYIINTTKHPVHLKDLRFRINAFVNQNIATLESIYSPSKVIDSTGCGDLIVNLDGQTGPVYHTVGIKDLPQIEEMAPVSDVRTCVATSNYKTDFYIGKDGHALEQVIDAQYLLLEANEHFAEVFYGTLFADRTDSHSGICATIYQAQQNYPKAVLADRNGLSVMLVPENVDKVVMLSGMAREQKFLLHFHSADETLTDIDNRSLIYQMPDRALIAPSVYCESNTMPDIFTKKYVPEVERCLVSNADGHARCYGMLNWGDAPDPGYTQQGRGNGDLVWTNNEYDYPHACALAYARSGIRRFLDYHLVAARHQIDVDICHYSDDPLIMGGQWEHTAGHCKNGTMVCSHEWVEGLLDYYHFTADPKAYECAISIGHNILRLLDTPLFHQKGGINARETGWAMRTLVALYIETNDEFWLNKCNWIIGHFETWEEEYGHWLSPYTDNTAIRVPFMISVAVGSLMRYYRVRPEERIKAMILRAVDDLIEHTTLPCGLFLYKQLPTLNRLGNNPLILEALAICYELTYDRKYLEIGMPTFEALSKHSFGGNVGPKKIFGDAVISSGAGTKGFGQSFIPITTFYTAAVKAELI
ncbi:MAG: hypothetical protein IKL73_00465 [Lachnospiraceae bacterium]|nr:hypothetical protein [Lachnospiraceae bacterium]